MSEWWYLDDGERKGPVDSNQLHLLFTSGQLDGGTLVWAETMKDWEPAENIAALALIVSSQPTEIPDSQSTEQREPRPPWYRHLGSTIALIFGGLSIVSGVAKPGPILIAGIIVILGALAYRSAKKRKWGEVKSTVPRIVAELAAILLIGVLIFGQNNPQKEITNDPVPNLVIPVLAVIPYVVMTLIPRRKRKPKSE